MTLHVYFKKTIKICNITCYKNLQTFNVNLLLICFNAHTKKRVQQKTLIL